MGRKRTKTGLTVCRDCGADVLLAVMRDTTRPIVLDVDEDLSGCWRTCRNIDTGEVEVWYAQPDGRTLARNPHDFTCAAPFRLGE